MNWYKKSQVTLRTETQEGITVLIDGKPYRCPGVSPHAAQTLKFLIRTKQWGKAKGLLNRWQCINERKEEAQKTQLSLF